MRVLHVHSGNMYGGVETLLVTLARHRDLCPEMEPHYALCFEGRLSEELTAAGACPPAADGVASATKARRLLRREQFNLVVCHSTWSQSLFGPVVHSLDLPLVFWLHGATNGLDLAMWHPRVQL